MPDQTGIVVADELDDVQNIAGQVDEISWQPPRDLTYDEWSSITHTLQTIGKALPFWLGDALAYGEQHFGEAFAQVIDETNYAKETLKKFKAVSIRIPKSRRRAGTSWSAHFAVCYLEPAIADKLLRLADEYELTVRDVKLVASWPDERKERLFEFANTRIQLRYAEIMAHVWLLDTPEAQDDAETEADFAGLPNGESFDSIQRFFASKGIPITFEDETTVVWEGGVRLSVVRNDRESYLNWELTL